MSWDKSSRGEARLQRLILEAAFLHREFLGMKSEENFRTKFSGVVHYTFDNDVLGAFAEPWRWGPEKLASHSDDGRGYGQLLPRRSANSSTLSSDRSKALRIQEDIRATNVVRILCEYALKAACRKDATGKIFQFEPHFYETSQDIRFFEEKAQAVRQTKVGTSTELLMRNSILLLRAQLRDSHSSQDIVSSIQNVSEVALTREFTGPARNVLARDNYHRLESTFGVREKLSDQSISALDDLEHNEGYAAAERLLKGFWVREFSKRKNASVKSIEADAKSFAKLAILNKALIDKGVSERVVLVTGSKEVVKNCYDIGPKLRQYIQSLEMRRLSNSESELLKVNIDSNWQTFFGFSKEPKEESAEFRWFDRFSLHYVRHLSAFSKGALIESNETGKLDDLFHGLFALAWQQNRFLRKDIEEIVQRPWRLRLSFFDSNSDVLIDDVLGQWERLTMRALEAKRSSDWNFPKRAEEYLSLRLADQSNITADDLTLEISEQVDRQRDRSMLELSDMGARALLEKGLLSVRNPPDLFFATLSNTNRIFQRLSIPDYYAKSPELFVKDYDNIDEDCVDPADTADGDDRQRSYLKFVVLGSVFASAEKWSTALGHAERAIGTITRFSKRIPSVKETLGSDDTAHMSGRESYYLAAICQRMLARNANDLEKSKNYLRLAEDAYLSDVDKRSSLEKVLGTARFKSERLAIALSHYYFSRWASAIEDDAPPHRCHDFDISPIMDAFTILREEISRESKYFGGPMTTLSKVSAATNIIQTATILEFRKEQGCDDIGFSKQLSWDLVERSLAFLRSSDARERAVETALVRAYKAAGALLLNDWDESGILGEDDLIALLDEAAANGVMHYDEWRYSALKTFLVNRYRNRNQKA